MDSYEQRSSRKAYGVDPNNPYGGLSDDDSGDKKNQPVFLTINKLIKRFLMMLSNNRPRKIRKKLRKKQHD